jgi:chaperone BCS1
MTVRLGEATRYQVTALWDRFYGEFDANGVYKERFLDRLAEFGLIEDKDGNKADMTKLSVLLLSRGSSCSIRGTWKVQSGQ